MSNIFSTKKIVDRKNETAYIIEDINKGNDSSRNKILFLWSDTGIGKTSIVSKVSHDTSLNKPIVIVDTPPINNKELIGNGDFISYIAESVSNYLKEQNWSLKDFLISGSSERLQKNESSKLLSNLTSLPFTVFSILCERALSLNDADTDKIINGFDLESILINLEYIKSSLETFSLVLNVSNIQNADSMSIMQLQKILSVTRGQYFIFEYTTKEKNTDNLWQLAKTFENVADIDIYEINELPIEYALTIINPSNHNIIEQLEKFYEEIAKGNLYKMYKIKNELDNTSLLPTFKDPIQLKIERLNYQQKLLLSIICLHDGFIKTEDFLDIITYISDYYYVSINDVKELDDFIEATNVYYKLQHASIIDSFDIGMENFASVAAFRFLEQYYISKIKYYEKDNVKKDEYTFLILKLYSIFNPTKILDKLNDFKQLIISCISEEQGKKLLEKIYYSLPDDTDENIKLHIINLGYEVGFYKSAHTIISQNNCVKENKLILECMLLNRIDKHLENIEKCNKLLKEKNHSEHFILIIHMIKMLSERSLNDVKSYEKTFKQIFDNKRFVNLYEYGFLLRNSQIVFSLNKSLKYIKQSIDFFKAQENFKDAACSELTYAVQLSRLGRLTEADEHLKNIKTILLNSTFEKHIVYVNQSAIELLKGNASDDILLLLEKSLLSATTNFDKVVILNNKLCWFIVNSVEERLFIDLKAQIDKLLVNEPDLRLHRRIFINYSKYYQHVLCDSTVSNAWLKKAKEIPSNNDELGDTYISGTCKNLELSFLAKQKFYISFITYWHFDIPIDGLN